MSNNTTKVNNPMKVITGKDTRWSYANVWEAKSINGGAPKFSGSLIIPKSEPSPSRRSRLPSKPPTTRARRSSRATASPSRLSPLSRILCVTAIPNAPMIPPTQGATS